TLRVLLVEDSELDAELLVRALQRGHFHIIHLRVSSKAELDLALRREDWDLILADHAMPGFSAPEALQIVKRHGVDVPFIIVSGYIEEETAVAAMRGGAHDYIMKDRLARLIPAVERELREAAVRRDLRRVHEELEQRVEKRTAELQKANTDLQKLLEERKRLEHELLEIAENERRRIGFDLHDELGQKLTGLAFMLKGLEQRLVGNAQSAAEEAHKAQSLVEQIIHDTHNLARQFSSMDARSGDLATVLKELAGNVEKMFDIGCAFSLKGEVPALPEHTKTQLYKISQEAVSNSIKHGKARNVLISVSGKEKDLVLTIKNDGLPFSEPATKNRMGLRIMNYRASTIGASLDIKPLNKAGTIVTCQLQLENPGAKSNSGPEA
ncbi:MAG TPA: response regulator, partial [Candidatus Dormibacteraeota bacterium]|nr:response regulator [Candidatus Dormibacteraeota bacterium]